MAFAPAFTQRFTAGAWPPMTAVADGARRLFGERDTLAYRATETGAFTVRRLPGGPVWTDVAATLGLDTASTSTLQTYTFGQPSMAPVGTPILVPFSTNLDGIHTLGFGILTASGAITLPTTVPGMIAWGRTAWSPDGARAAFYTYGFRPTGPQAQLLLLTFGSSTPTLHTLAVEPDRQPWSASWSDEGQRLTLIDSNVDTSENADCRRRVFHVTSARTLTLLHSEPVTDPGSCSTEYLDAPWWDQYLALQGSSGGSGGSGGGTGGDGGGVALSVTRGMGARTTARSGDALTLLRQRLRVPPGSRRVGR